MNFESMQAAIREFIERIFSFLQSSFGVIISIGSVLFIFWVLLTPDPKLRLLMQKMFSSLVFTAVVWPMAFVLLEVTLSLLVSVKPVRAEGNRKFRVWFRFTTEDNNKFAISPLSVSQISDFDDHHHEILDIELIPSDLLETFRFGLDLCIGALAADMTILLALQRGSASTSFPTGMVVTASLLVVHLFIAVLGILMLGIWGNDDNRGRRLNAIWSSNFMGLAAIFVSFAVLGNLLAQ